jgi:hypothetical protein
MTKMHTPRITAPAALLLHAATCSAGSCGSSYPDHSGCEDYAAGFKFMFFLGYSCDSKVLHLARQVSAEAEQAVLDMPVGSGSWPVNEDNTVGDVCPGFCTEVCADIPTDESCGGVDYCFPEVSATVTLSGSVDQVTYIPPAYSNYWDYPVDRMTMDEFKSVLTAAVCGMESYNMYGPSRPQPCLKPDIAVQGGSIVASFTMVNPYPGDLMRGNSDHIWNLECKMANHQRSDCYDVFPHPACIWSNGGYSFGQSDNYYMLYTGVVDRGGYGVPYSPDGTCFEMMEVEIHRRVR